MAPVGTCIVCEQVKVSKKYRTVTIDRSRRNVNKNHRSKK